MHSLSSERKSTFWHLIYFLHHLFLSISSYPFTISCLGCHSVVNEVLYLSVVFHSWYVDCPFPFCFHHISYIILVSFCWRLCGIFVGVQHFSFHDFVLMLISLSECAPVAKHSETNGIHYNFVISNFDNLSTHHRSHHGSGPAKMHCLL